MRIICRREACIRFLTEILRMTVFDIFVFIVAAIAVFTGWRRGFAVQAFNFFAIVLGLFVAATTGPVAGAKLGFDPSYAVPAGFLVIFLLVAGVLLLIGRFMRKMLRSIGLGSLDVLLGILVSLLKTALILGILCTVFDKFNDGAHFIDRSKLDKSVTYRPLCRTVEVLGVWGREVGTGTEEVVRDALDKI